VGIAAGIVDMYSLSRINRFLQQGLASLRISFSAQGDFLLRLRSKNAAPQDFLAGRAIFRASIEPPTTVRVINQWPA